jgi:hypothetical protein
MFENPPPTSQIDYTEIIKALFLLIGGIVTAIVAVITAGITIFGGAISESWKEKRKAKEQAKEQPKAVYLNSDRLFTYAEIFQHGKNLVDNPLNNFDRVLMIRTINGVEKPRYVNVVFGHQTHKNFDPTERYKKVPVFNDAHYQKMLANVQKGITVELTTETMEQGLLLDFYRNEGVRFSSVFQFDKKEVGEGQIEIWYMSISTYSEFTETDRLEISLFVNFARSKTNYET